jgi:hypothetical protein
VQAADSTQVGTDSFRFTLMDVEGRQSLPVSYNLSVLSSFAALSGGGNGMGGAVVAQDEQRNVMVSVRIDIAILQRFSNALAIFSQIFCSSFEEPSHCI